MMVLKTALFCDFAQVTGDGKANLFGIFQTFQLGSPMPAFVQPFWVYLFIQAEEGEEVPTGPGKFVFSLSSPAGKVVFGMEAESSMEAKAMGPGIPWSQQIVLQCPGLIAEQSGTYSSKVELLGHDLGGPVVYVVETAGANSGH